MSDNQRSSEPEGGAVRGTGESSSSSEAVPQTDNESITRSTLELEAEDKKRRESTDAAVETAQEATVEANADIAELTRDMFQKMIAYLQGDLSATAEDYKLLEQMNLVTAKKYGDMKNIALQIGDSMTGLQSKYQSLQPYLDQIDQVEESVTSLEQAALRLDAYSKRLEAKFKQLEKR
ncbi:biogenesis of lysosome-related organelles complex 1 subunit 2-like [Lytechinus variegatus]|uniref:biogenesis of lysosome-related organelles complex 1 subunit 2-like n=1 Tax=Lytechinus variegatus TaxID=7654 RepID=UPI001BB198C8|nr:biogenesis of lysosome-related organelles complex 1 subunit 2-like [Lytechinus variegatus]